MRLAEMVVSGRPKNECDHHNDAHLVLASESKGFSNAVGQRHTSLDWLRFFACIGIVWFHCGGVGAVVGYAGLPVLISLSVALASVPGKSNQISITLKKRARRLLVPWAFWCIVYAVWRVLSAVTLRKTLGAEFDAWMLLSGPAIHLWYLPYAFVATCLASLLCARQTYRSKSAIAFWLLLVAFVLIACSWRLTEKTMPRPLPQWTFAFPGVVIGMALPQCANPPRRRLHTLQVTYVVALAALVAWLLGWGGLAVPYVIGIVGLAFSWAFAVSKMPAVDWLTGLSYGIYLVHPLVASVIGPTIGAQHNTAFAIIVLVASGVVIAVSKRSPLRMFV